MFYEGIFPTRITPCVERRIVDPGIDDEGNTYWKRYQGRETGLFELYFQGMERRSKSDSHGRRGKPPCLVCKINIIFITIIILDIDTCLVRIGYHSRVDGII